MRERHPEEDLPVVSSVARILVREGLVQAGRRHRRAHPGCPKSVRQGPNDIWAADYKGHFRSNNGGYCSPLTVSDLASRYILGCDAHPAISLDRSPQHFTTLFRTYGLPNRIRTVNRVLFASSALARLSTLSVWFVKLGIYPGQIEPGKPQHNGIHERMHRTLKQEATIPPAGSLRGQQRKYDGFRREFYQDRPHEALAMKRPAQAYQSSSRGISGRIEPYDCPSNYKVRWVSRCGTIRVLGKQIFVSQTLNEAFVGLEEAGDGVYDVYSCFYQIGRCWLQANKIHNIVSRVGVSRRQVDLATRL